MVVVGLFVGWLVVSCFVLFLLPKGPFNVISLLFNWPFHISILPSGNSSEGFFLLSCLSSPEGISCPVINFLQIRMFCLFDFQYFCVFFFVFCSLRAYLKLDYVVDYLQKKHKKPPHFCCRSSSSYIMSCSCAYTRQFTPGKTMTSLSERSDFLYYW